MHEPEIAMTAAGWAFLATGWTAIIAVTVVCVSRLLGKQQAKEPDEDAE